MNRDNQLACGCMQVMCVNYKNKTCIYIYIYFKILCSSCGLSTPFDIDAAGNEKRAQKIDMTLFPMCSTSLFYITSFAHVSYFFLSFILRSTLRLPPSFFPYLFILPFSLCLQAFAFRKPTLSDIKSDPERAECSFHLFLRSRRLMTSHLVIQGRFHNPDNRHFATTAKMLRRKIII